MNNWKKICAKGINIVVGGKSVQNVCESNEQNTNTILWEKKYPN